MSKSLPGTVRQDRCETRPLRGVGNAEARATPTPTSFGQRVVVNLTHVPQHKVKQLGLLFVWVEAVRVGSDQLFALLLCNVTPYRCSGNIASRTDVVGARPQIWQSAIQERKLNFEFVAGKPVEPVHDLVGRKRWRVTTEKVNMIWHYFKFDNVSAELFCLVYQEYFEAVWNIAIQNRASKFGAPNKMIRDFVNRMSCSFRRHKLIIVHLFGHINVKGSKARQFPSLINPGAGHFGTV